MGRKPKPIMSETEMYAMQTEKSGSKLYPEVAAEAKAEQISSIVRNTRAELNAVNEVFSLENTPIDKIKAQIDKYLEVCELTHTLPSLAGLSRAIGYTRYGVTKYIKENPNTKTAKYLELVRDALSDMLDNAALAGSLHPIYSIFVQKSVYCRTDRSELLIGQIQPGNNPLGDAPSEEEIEAIKQRYLEAAVDDGE